MLQLADYRLEVVEGETTAICTARADGEIQVAGASLADAGGRGRLRPGDALGPPQPTLRPRMSGPRRLELDPIDDDVAVTCWRAERLLALGYHPREATLLALSRIDVHELESLIGQGCPLETAVRIAA